jgi:polar amino acid transport system substrate-binding protein
MTVFTHAWRAAAIAVLAVCSLVTEPLAQDAGVPGFLDPSQRLDRPDLGGIRVIRFLTEDDYPPMHFTSDDGRLAGFNVDLARAVCDALGLACTIQARRWDTLLDSLREGRGDAVVASMRITPRLRTSFSASLPYLRTPARFVTRAGSRIAVSPRGLTGHGVAVVAGSAHEAYLATFFPGSRRLAFGDLEQAQAALQSGAAEALFADGLTLAIWLNGKQSADCCAFSGGAYTESRYFGEGVAIVMRRDDVVLRRAVDWGLAKVAETGAYAEIYLRYFPIGFY